MRSRFLHLHAVLLQHLLHLPRLLHSRPHPCYRCPDDHWILTENQRRHQHRTQRCCCCLHRIGPGPIHPFLFRLEQRLRLSRLLVLHPSPAHYRILTSLLPSLQTRRLQCLLCALRVLHLQHMQVLCLFHLPLAVVLLSLLGGQGMEHAKLLHKSVPVLYNHINRVYICLHKHVLYMHLQKAFYMRHIIK